MKNRIHKKELYRFLIGGGSAVIVDYMVYRVLLMAGAGMSFSKGISYVCGAIAGFLINKFWTFESKNFCRMEILRYIILYAISACINAGVNKLVISVVNVQIAGFFVATGVSTVINFLGQKYFVFMKKEST